MREKKISSKDSFVLKVAKIRNTEIFTVIGAGWIKRWSSFGHELWRKVKILDKGC